MQHLKILNRKEIKVILKFLKENFDMSSEPDYVFFENPKGKIYLLSKKFADLDEKRLRINNLGLYFGKKEKDGFRLTLEGAQLIGAKKNIIEISKDQMAGWMRGEDLEAEHDSNVYVIIKHKKDILGCGKFKDGKILNSVPKERRITKVS
jgi:NOL1/NOP2/fmu family ribosome biogenesis protein